ncbi:DUF2993 domain-containing protein [Cellulomonas sp. B6]|uniref:LmeA family phospholipid-binding protein n=1 Tax=Cellulomonas sp. B6 TaxID=1295626 RepID=UPI00073C31CC|nr:DUF2993 domain-containing protein [Cellulomonas sp. B6]KSW29299.1 hypothetical protein ATM99_08615 [Cellulomonas sp. B6]
MGAKGVVAGVVALGLVGVGAYVGDGLARSAAEDRAAQVVTQELRVDGTPDVRIDGFPFLTQLLGRSLDDVGATAQGVTFEGVRATDVVLDATDVSLDAPYRVGRARLEATLPPESIKRAVADRAGVVVEVTVDGDVLRASGDVLGAPLTAGLVPRVEDGRLLVDLRDVTLGVGALQVDRLPDAISDRLSGFEIPLGGLPEGVRLEGVDVVHDGVRVVLGGTDVVLEQTR